MLLAIVGVVLLAFGILSLATRSPLLIAVHLIPGAVLVAAAVIRNAGTISDSLGGEGIARGAWFGTNAIAQSAAAVVILGLVLYLAERHPIHLDWTEAGIFTLSDASENVLEQIPADGSVEVFAFYSEPEAIRPRLDLYAYASDRFSYRIIDPRVDPLAAQRFEIQVNDAIVVCGGPCDTAKATVKTRDSTEQRITEAIRSVVSKRRKVYFVTGHGEAEPALEGRESASLFASVLEAENVEQATLLLAQSDAVPEDADALILAGPAYSLFDRELTALDTYLRSGGSVLILADALQKAKLEEQLLAWKIQLGEDVLLTPQRFVVDVYDYGTHPITDKMRGLPATLPLVRTVRPAAGSGPDVTVLMRTDQDSYAAPQAEIEPRIKERGQVYVDADVDEQGPLPIAVARTFAPADPSDRAGRLIVVGDADFIRDPYLGQAANADLALNMVSWLVGDEGFITIDRPLPRASRLRIEAPVYDAFAYLGVLLVPEALMLCGAIVWWRRRSA